MTNGVFNFMLGILFEPVYIVIILYFLSLIFIAYTTSRGERSVNSYFIGNGKLGGFAFAMTVAATYVSASSFVGGPGIAYSVGLSWLLVAMVQVPVMLFIYGFVGEALMQFAKEHSAINIIDYVHFRFGSVYLTFIASILLLFFLAVIVSISLLAGGLYLQYLFNIDYIYTLAIFTVVTGIYLFFGGFKAIVLTDIIQGFVMLVASVILFAGIVSYGGGLNNIINNINNINPNLLTSDFGGKYSYGYLLSFWILVGIGWIAHPAMIVRCMASKDRNALYSGIVLSTIITGGLTLIIHLDGFLARGLGLDISNTDQIMPAVSKMILSPWLFGIFSAGLLASIMSTVDSIVSTSASIITKNIFGIFNAQLVNYKTSKFVVFAILFIDFLLSIKPLGLIAFINLNALGLLEASFLSLIVLGVMFKGVNKYGAFAGLIVGLCSYAVFILLDIHIWGMHYVVIPVILSFLANFIVSKYTLRTN